MIATTPAQFIVLNGAQAGLRFSVVDGCLIIEGPRSADGLARASLDRKAEVIEYLSRSCRSCYAPLWTPEAQADRRCASCRTGDISETLPVQAGTCHPPRPR